MINIKQDNQFIPNLLLNCIEKNGNKNTAKNLILNSSIDIVNNDCFIELFENLILKLVLPFQIFHKKNKSKNIYKNTYKSVSNLIVNICKSIKKNRKRVSFDFYFKNEIYKLLNKSSNLNILKKNFITIFKNTISINKNNKKKLKKNLSTKNDILLKKVNIKYVQKHFIYGLLLHYKNKNNNKYLPTIKNIFNKNKLIIGETIKT
uniref:Uncharacterized protein ORF204 n=1 Tax=Theileria annulata TaxID=5874 RepID=O78380_THEAN|nr:hypothetical protein [Theileria annulata]